MSRPRAVAPMRAPAGMAPAHEMADVPPLLEAMVGWLEPADGGGTPFLARLRSWARRGAARPPTVAPAATDASAAPSARRATGWAASATRLAALTNC